PDAVLRVVVYRLDVEGRVELLFRRRETSGTEVGARQRLPNGALRGLEFTGALQRDHCGVGVAVRQQTHALGERRVRVGVAWGRHVSRLLDRSRVSLWYNPLAFPSIP